MYTTSIIPLVRTLLGEIHKEVCHEKFWQASTARSYFDLRCPSFIINVECMSVCPVSNIKFWCLWFRTKIDNSGKLSDKTGKFHPVIHLRCAECFESQQQSTKCLNALRSSKQMKNLQLARAVIPMGRWRMVRLQVSRKMKDVFITYDFVSFTSLCIKDRNE